MALLRNREVEILSRADHIDNSTFLVRYPDYETEYAKMHELSFTQAEADTYVKPILPVVNILEEPKLEPVAKKKK